MTTTTAESEPAALLEELKIAVAAANAAEQGMTTAQAEHLSRSMRVGTLLLEAKKLHPATEDFKAFLKEVDGLGLSRAYDLMRLAGGRTTDEELRKETRDRVEKHHAKKRLSKPKGPSVTSPPVTESARQTNCRDHPQRNLPIAQVPKAPVGRIAKLGA